ncbi:MAG: arylamine N-acetyltransferase [Thiothrix sp.]|nr:MAG: arylamine N-acetyltransferase [Thiothrix sp.]
MYAENFKLDDYCRRIRFTGEVKPDFASVKTLMLQHLKTIPFENLNVLAGKVISLKPEDIVDKLIHQQRGGYCYEMNGLFALALTALGLEYQWVAARPLFYPVRRPRTHAALIVNFEGVEWLLDLGFGSYGIREPMRLDLLNQPVQQGYDQFMLSPEEDGDLAVQALVDGVWIKQYGFNRSPVEWVDFAPANWMNSTHPDAIFTQKNVIVLFTATGRKTLFGQLFKEYKAGQVSQITVQTEQIGPVLEQEFNLIKPMHA